MSFSVVANQKAIEMLPTIWANSFDRSKWSSKVFNEDKTKGAMIVSVPIGRGQSPPYIENKVLGGHQSSVASAELCAMVPLKKYCGGISNSNIFPIGISFPSRR